jgi:4-alpha-glucanotransferase
MNLRASGILLHPTSLSNAYPIGDLGPTASGIVDFLFASGQRRWQMLPIGPTGGDNSPYQSASAFAGNPLLLSPDRLVEQGLLSREEISLPASEKTGSVNFSEAARWKMALLKKAFEHFREQKHVGRQSEFVTFLIEESYWLGDFSLFSAIQESEGTADWTRWQPELRTRQPEAMLRAQKRFADDILYHEFIQWQFSVQWKELKTSCAPKGIRLIGDIPLFVAHQSADVWAHPELFKLNAAGNPTVVAGVPPDYFSKTGQLWGLPVYRWEALQAEKYRWWIERLRMAFSRFDINRLDHFIGFVRTYEISAQAKTALKGKYLPGGGAAFFKAIREALGPLPFIADDLGDTTPEVVALLDQFQIPGTRVLQFEFGSELQNSSNPRAPHPLETVVYTGTHDNDTTAGWFEKLPDTQREALRNKLKASDQEIVWAMIRAALASPANTAIVPAQDLLELGSEARMNLPGIAKGNWGWRLLAGVLTEKLAQRLRSLTMEYGRLMNCNPVHASRFQTDDLTPQIAKRAYEIYEQRGRQSGQSNENWFQAEREINMGFLEPFQCADS